MSLQVSSPQPKLGILVPDRKRTRIPTARPFRPPSAPEATPASWFRRLVDCAVQFGERLAARFRQQGAPLLYWKPVVLCAVLTLAVTVFLTVTVRSSSAKSSPLRSERVAAAFVPAAVSEPAAPAPEQSAALELAVAFPRELADHQPRAARQLEVNLVAEPPPAAAVIEAPVVPAAFEEEQADGVCGTQVEFIDNPVVAALQAAAEHKLLYVLHVSGDFEDPGFT